MSTRSLQRVSASAPSPLSAHRVHASTTALVAGVVFVVAYNNGGYGLSSRTLLALAVWWLIILAIGFGLAPLSVPPRAAVLVGGLLAGIAVWTLASTAWAPNAEKAFEEFNRISLYLGVFTAVVVVSTRRTTAAWADGLGLGILATALVALASRLFPGTLPSRDIGEFLPNAAARLSFPVGYWNALAILAALAFPLCFRAALAGRARPARALALAAVPLLAAVIYLASSRGGVAVAGIGTVAFLALTARRWSAAGVVLAAGVGSTVAVVGLRSYETLVNGPLGSDLAASEGRRAAVLLAVSAALSAALLIVSERVVGKQFRAPRGVGWAVTAAAVLLFGAGLAFADPAGRFDEFKQPPSVQQPDSASAHLFSGEGSGRWQFWTVAVDQFQSAPLAGRGAGSYEYWWTQHASFRYTLRNAHSLYLETLGELGLVGFALLAAVFAGGLGVAVARTRALQGGTRITAASLTAVLAAFAAAGTIEWIWQVTVVAVIGIAALALLAGPGFAPAAEPPADVAARRSRSQLAAGVALLAGAWALMCAAAIPWLTAARISDSQAAARRGDLAAAGRAALDAKTLQPWAATPYLQLALVAEGQGEFDQAERWVAESIRRNSEDWRVWYVGARIASLADRQTVADRRYARAAALNPLSPIFAGEARG